MKKVFYLEGLDCANCASKIEEAIAKIEGVNEVSVHFLTQKVVVEFMEEKEEMIMEKIKKTILKEEPDIKIKGM